MAYLLGVDLNVLLQLVSDEIEDEVMDKVKEPAHNDERKLQLVSDLHLL